MIFSSCKTYKIHSKVRGAMTWEQFLCVIQKRSSRNLRPYVMSIMTDFYDHWNDEVPEPILCFFRVDTADRLYHT